MVIDMSNILPQERERERERDWTSGREEKSLTCGCGALETMQNESGVHPRHLSQTGEGRKKKMIADYPSGKWVFDKWVNEWGR